MVTRVLELIARPGKSEAVCDAIEFEVRPRLRAMPGFMELVTLISEGEPRLIVLMTVWRSESAATRYAKDLCPHILELLQPYLALPFPKSSFQFAQDCGNAGGSTTAKSID